MEKLYTLRKKQEWQVTVAQIMYFYWEIQT